MEKSELTSRIVPPFVGVPYGEKAKPKPDEVLAHRVDGERSHMSYSPSNQNASLQNHMISQSPSIPKKQQVTTIFANSSAPKKSRAGGVNKSESTEKATNVGQTRAALIGELKNQKEQYCNRLENMQKEIQEKPTDYTAEYLCNYGFQRFAEDCIPGNWTDKKASAYIDLKDKVHVHHYTDEKLRQKDASENVKLIFDVARNEAEQTIHGKDLNTCTDAELQAMKADLQKTEYNLFRFARKWTPNTAGVIPTPSVKSVSPAKAALIQELNTKSKQYCTRLENMRNEVKENPSNRKAVFLCRGGYASFARDCIPGNWADNHTGDYLDLQSKARVDYSTDSQWEEKQASENVDLIFVTARDEAEKMIHGKDLTTCTDAELETMKANLQKAEYNLFRFAQEHTPNAAGKIPE